MRPSLFPGQPVCRAIVWIALGLTLAVISPGLPLRAHDDHPHASPLAVAPAEAHRPSRLPDRIILSPVADPARGMAVAWRTSTDAPQGFAQLAAATHGPELRERAVTIPAHTEAHPTDLGPSLCHAVEFADLEPGTRYAYRVGDGANWSEWLQFETASAEPARFQFVHFGDAQNDILSMWSRVVREAGRHAPRAQLMIHSGDLVNTGENDAQWGEWFRAGSFLHAQIPSLPIPGNHEYVKVGEGDAAISRLSHHWRRQFTLPENGPPGLEETCCSLVYGDTRIVALNSNEKLAEQADFLAACTVSFNAFTYPPAEGLEGQELFRKAYAAPSIGFIATQVAAHINDWANFTKSSGQS